MFESTVFEDHPPARFIWEIENCSGFKDKCFYTDSVIAGGYKWRVLIYPNGNNVEDRLSMYLHSDDSRTLPHGCSICAKCSLSVVNQMHHSLNVRKGLTYICLTLTRREMFIPSVLISMFYPADTQHLFEFTSRTNDCGFESFMPLSEQYDEGRGYNVNDTCIIEAVITVRRSTVDYLSLCSRKETGYVGLKNQGATHYLNSFLQTLYHIPYLKKAVYLFPTTGNDMPSGSIPLELQSLFYNLQFSGTSVATEELTKSFGLDTYESFKKHDVQEFSRVLTEKLEEKYKGSIVEGEIKQLFEGHNMKYVECVNVHYISIRKQTFSCLQLDVKGCRSVYASFDKYTEVERLEGGRRYRAGPHGLQDAEKRLMFIDFPPVLQLQLKRFEYDPIQDTMVKINNRYQFPLQLDLDRGDGKYLSPLANRSFRNLYTLHSVLVHSGGAHDGYYYAYIRPTLSDQWFKFDDERVTKEEDMTRVWSELYGGKKLHKANLGVNSTPSDYTKNSNACMLVYIRESEKARILCKVNEMDMAEHLRVACDRDLHKQIGKDVHFDLVDFDKVCCFHMQNHTSFALFQEEVAKELGVPVQYQRFWRWEKRSNQSYRPVRPLTPQEKDLPVGYIRKFSDMVKNAELHLFLEVEVGWDLQPMPLPEKTEEEIMLFFIFYDREKEELRYVGRLFVKGTGKPIDILSKLKQLAGIEQGEEIELVEEICFTPNLECVHIDEMLTFKENELQDGDIICFAKVVNVENTATLLS
ncbi:putative ubiquitinyl hydrolase 1 [Helianthus debilis subsp. tardiflorus]